jgi:thioredoxin-like negative regulator of GroEL
MQLGRFEQALEVSAGHNNTAAPRELQLIHARALTALERNELAAAAYRPLIEAEQEALAPADYFNYARACLSSGKVQEARQILAECFDRHGYLEGLGLQLSLAAESGGDRSASLIYALLDSLQAVATGRLKRDRLCENLDSLATAGDGESLPPGLQAFARHLAAEEWPRAFERAKSITFPREAEILRSIAAVRHRPGDRAAGEALYRQLPAYRRYAPTYAALMASLRSSAEYRFAVARPLLEQALLIAPEGPVAQQARRELAGLLGIEERYAEDVRCEREIVLLQRAAQGGAPPEETAGVLLRILALPEHPYTHRAVLSLRALLGMPHIKAYVRACLPEAPARARRRVEPFL